MNFLIFFNQSIFVALAEVLRIRTIDSSENQNNEHPISKPTKLYYVHYIDYNKRLDEWVPIERMRVDKVQPPASSSTSNSSSNVQSILSNLQIVNSNTTSTTPTTHSTSLIGEFLFFLLYTKLFFTKSSLKWDLKFY